MAGLLKKTNCLKQLSSGRLTQLYRPEVGNLHGKPSYSGLKTKIEQSPVLLIRHAASTSNEASAKMALEAAQSESGFLPVHRWLEVYGDENLIDAKLTAKGVEQCEVAGAHANQIDFSTVYVSPLRRTMETAYHTFKRHPNFAKINFVLAPEIREKIGITGDVPLANQEWLTSYELVYKDIFEGRLDLGPMAQLLNDPRQKPWYFSSLLPETQRQISSKMQVYFRNDYTSAIVDCINSQFPDRFETIQNIKARGDSFRDHLFAKTLTQMDTSTAQEEQQGGRLSWRNQQRKIGVVGHSIFFKVYTASETFWRDVYDEESHDRYPTDEHSLTMMNCEIHPDLSLAQRLQEHHHHTARRHQQERSSLHESIGDEDESLLPQRQDQDGVLVPRLSRV